MHIAFSVDDQYARHLGVVMVSILKRLKRETELHIYIVTDGISPENKIKLQTLATTHKFSLRYLDVRLSEFDDLPITLKHLNVATYFRLKLPDLLPELDKLLYLDVDIIVNGDLSPLWNIELSANEWIGAVLDPIVIGHIPEEVGMQKDDPYFNAGILLMNLSQLRLNDFSQKCQDYVLHHGHLIKYVDQDILNYVCKGHVKWLSPKYNYMLEQMKLLWQMQPDYTCENAKKFYSRDEIDEAKSKPVIVHFIGATKAWHYTSYSRYSKFYKQYLKMTPWKKMIYDDRSPKAIRRKIKFMIKSRYKGLFGK